MCDDPDTGTDRAGAEGVDSPGDDPQDASESTVDDSAVPAEDDVDEAGEVCKGAEHEQVADEVGARPEGGTLKAVLWDGAWLSKDAARMARKGR